jgi:heat shock protein HslJ
MLAALTLASCAGAGLPAAFQRDGMAVEAEGRRREDAMSIGMVGPMIELLRIRERAGEEVTGPAPALGGTRWRLEDLAGAGVIDDAQATLEFGEGGTVSGSSTCNRFTGTATVSGDSIAFGPLATTRRACAEALMNQETSYLAALADAQRFKVDGSALRIYTAGRPAPLRFTAQ